MTTKSDKTDLKDKILGRLRIYEQHLLKELAKNKQKPLSGNRVINNNAILHNKLDAVRYLVEHIHLHEAPQVKQIEQTVDQWSQKFAVKLSEKRMKYTLFQSDGKALLLKIKADVNKAKIAANKALQKEENATASKKNTTQ